MIGPLGLLPDHKAQIAIALACGDRELVQRSLGSCPVRGSGKRQVEMRNHVQIGARIQLGACCAPIRLPNSRFAR